MLNPIVELLYLVLNLDPLAMYIVSTKTHNTVMQVLFLWIYKYKNQSSEIKWLA